VHFECLTKDEKQFLKEKNDEWLYSSD
jgi:hypothetical protein